MLSGPIAAGTWHLIGDGENLTQPVTVRFDILWRVLPKTDTILASVAHSFVPHPAGANQYDAVEFDADLPGIAAPAKAGDELVLRFTVTGGAGGALYIPNGDGSDTNGRIPKLTLP